MASSQDLPLERKGVQLSSTSQLPLGTYIERYMEQQTGHETRLWQSPGECVGQGASACHGSLLPAHLLEGHCRPRLPSSAKLWSWFLGPASMLPRWRLRSMRWG